MNNRIFYLALFLSLAVHLTLFGLLSLKKEQRRLKKTQPIEITYQSVKTKTQQVKKRITQPKETRQAKLPKKVKLFKKSTEKFSGPQFENPVEDIQKISRKVTFDKKQAPKIKTMDIGRNISIPMLKSEKITNANYLNYRQTIRQKIRQQAFTFTDYSEFDDARVYLTFILSRKGDLKDVQIINGRTQANSYMRNLALRSIKEASPFLPFPKDLNYPELTYNIEIVFELGQ